MLFFGASAGRSGTMLLANLLNSEPSVTCVHEGKFRLGEESGEQILPFLTLENRRGYEYPETKSEIIASKRPVDVLTSLHETHGFLGDIAYNNSVFVEELSTQFPDAKFLISIRDGRDFVRSATVLKGEDLTPVGWGPREKELTPLERYISLGRLQPREGDPLKAEWNDLDCFEQNCWLWNETNKVIFDALEKIPSTKYHVIRLEDFKSDGLQTYKKIREFLGVPGETSAATEKLLLSPQINVKSTKDLPHHSKWTDQMNAVFWKQCSPMMEKLNYVG